MKNHHTFSSSLGLAALNLYESPNHLRKNHKRIKEEIRTRLPLGRFGSDFLGLVPEAGVEPARCRHHWILRNSEYPDGKRQKTAVERKLTEAASP